MLFTVVLDGDFHVVPTHVEIGEPRRIRRRTGICVCGRGRPASHQDQVRKPDLLRGLRTASNRVQRSARTRDPRRPGVSSSQQLDISRFDFRGWASASIAAHSGEDRVPTAEVQCGPSQRRTGTPSTISISSSSNGHRTILKPGARCRLSWIKLNRPSLHIDPLTAMQRAAEKPATTPRRRDHRPACFRTQRGVKSTSRLT